MKSRQFWICTALCLVMFFCAYPFYHDMYIAGIHTLICIGLNAFSSVLFSTLLYCKWTKCMNFKRKSVFFILTILQAIGQGIFSVMNWASFFFLPLSALVLILLFVSFFRKKTKS